MISNWYSLDGLNSVRYTVVNHTDLPLYTWIHVDLKGNILEKKLKTAKKGD